MGNCTVTAVLGSRSLGVLTTGVDAPLSPRVVADVRSLRFRTENSMRPASRKSSSQGRRD